MHFDVDFLGHNRNRDVSVRAYRYIRLSATEPSSAAHVIYKIRRRTSCAITGHKLKFGPVRSKKFGLKSNCAVAE